MWLDINTSSLAKTQFMFILVFPKLWHAEMCMEKEFLPNINKNKNLFSLNNPMKDLTPSAEILILNYL